MILCAVLGVFCAVGLGLASTSKPPAELPRSAGFGPSGLFNGIFLANTYWDAQHWGSCQRMIDFQPGSQYVHFSWMSLNSRDPQDPMRGAMYGCWDWTTQTWVSGMGGIMVNNPGDAGGFASIAVDPNGNPVEFNQCEPDGQQWVQVSRFPIPGFSLFMADNLPGDNLLPKGATGSGGSEIYYHVCATDSSANLADPIIAFLNYFRYSKNADLWEGPVVLDSAAMESHVVLVDGERVIIAFAKPRDYSPGYSIYDNDLAYYESRVSGADWLAGGPSLWESGGGWNITDIADSDEKGVYFDIAGGFTSDGQLHLLCLAVSTLITPDTEPLLYHWSEDWAGGNSPAVVSPGSDGGWVDSFFDVVRGSEFWHPGWPFDLCAGRPGEWNLALAKPCLAIGDGSTTCSGGNNLDYLYVTYTQFGSHDQLDYADTSSSGYQNGNIWLSISADEGRTWSPQQCITTEEGTVGGTPTRSPDCDSLTGAGGPCRSEHWSSTAGTVNDTLHVFYVGDLSAGSIVYGEGNWTENDMMYLPIFGGDGGLCPVAGPVLEAWMTPPETGGYYTSPEGVINYEELTIANYGNVQLVVTVTVDGAEPWLTIDGMSSLPPVSIPAGAKQTFAVAMDGSSLSIGLHQVNILMEHNDGARTSPLVLPVSFYRSAGISVSQVDFLFDYATQPNSNWGRVEVETATLLATEGLSRGYLNGYGDDGWMIQNLIIDDDQTEKITMYFDLGNMIGTAVPMLSFHLQLTAAPLVEFADGPRTTIPVDRFGYNAEAAPDGILLTWLPSPPLPQFDFDVSTFEEAIKNEEDENIQAAMNQCVPASVANSLQFLENHYPEIEIPHDNVSGLRGDNSLVGRLDEHMGRRKCTPIDADSACSCPDELPTRTDGCGVTPREMLRGKFSYLKANGLEDAFVHKYQGYSFTPDPDQFPDSRLPEGQYESDGITATDESVDGKVTWEWIYEEIKNGEDVELLIGYEDDKGEFTGGHAVRVYGAGKIVGCPYVLYKHDALQTDQDLDDNDGLEEVMAYAGVDSDFDGILNFGSADAEICGAISESPKDHTPTIELNQIDFDVQGSVVADADWGSADITFMGAENIQYLNISVNGSWQVRNVPVLSREGVGVAQTMTYCFDLGVPPGQDLTSVEYGFTLTETIFAAAPPTTGTAVVFDRDVVIHSGAAGDPIPPLQPAHALIADEAVEPVVHAHADFPNQECGPQECIPAAVSNSMKFLNDKHGLGLDEADISIEHMKTATNWGTKTVASAPGPGVDRVIDPYPEDLPDPYSVDGAWWRHDDNAAAGEKNAWWEDKQTYMENNNIPVTTRKITDIAAIAVEIDAGQDVELQGDWHTAAIVGITENEDGTYSIDIAHDTEQGNEGGTVTETITYDPATGEFTGSPGFFDGSSFQYAVVECPEGDCNCGARGDIDNSGSATPLDVVYLVSYVYKSLDGRVYPEGWNCLYLLGDHNCSGGFPNPLDVTYLVNYVYKSQDALCFPCNQ
jgi:hypothetical protein